MSDIIREVDEELRREQLAKFWQRYGGYIALAAVLLVAATAGWRGYQWYAERESARASAQLEAARALTEDATKGEEARAALSALVANAPASYRTLARLTLAAETGKKDAKEGAAAFDAVAADASVEPALRDLARIRAASLLVDVADVAEVRKRVEPLLGQNANYGHSAKELLALALYRSGDKPAAQKLFLELAFDPNTPQGIRQRAQLMQSFLFGDEPTVAPATTPPAAATPPAFTPPPTTPPAFTPPPAAAPPAATPPAFTPPPATATPPTFAPPPAATPATAPPTDAPPAQQ